MQRPTTRHTPQTHEQTIARLDAIARTSKNHVARAQAIEILASLGAPTPACAINYGARQTFHVPDSAGDRLLWEREMQSRSGR